jgi:hypothetical protein
MARAIFAEVDADKRAGLLALFVPQMRVKQSTTGDALQLDNA